MFARLIVCLPLGGFKALDFNSENPQVTISQRQTRTGPSAW